MKKILSIIIVLCSFILGMQNISAKVTTTRDIELRAKEKDRAPRSVFPVHAWQENTNIRVSFLEPPLEAIIKITNADGEVVEEMVAKLPQHVQIPMYGYTGTYTIEISYGDTVLCGLFKYNE